jgi:hypothetical protein
MSFPQHCRNDKVTELETDDDVFMSGEHLRPGAEME